MRDQSEGIQAKKLTVTRVRTRQSGQAVPAKQQTFAIPMQYVVEMLTNKLILFNTSSVDTHGDGGEARNVQIASEPL